jgi:hypothetical protein
VLAVARILVSRQDASEKRKTMEASGVQGVQVGGREPKALLLNDGTRLALEDEGPGGRYDWMLLGDGASGDRELSVADAIRIAGDRHAEYVRIRTRSEVAWLRLVSEWFEQEARRLDTELTSADERKLAA